MIRNICDQIKSEMLKVDKLSSKWENNLVDFFCDIPKDLSYGIINDFFDVPSFLCTESDEELGLSSEKSKASKKLIKHFEGWRKDSEEKDTPKQESIAADDIPF